MQDNLVSLIGCFCCTPLAFIYPCWFHLKLIPNIQQTLWTKISNYAILIFGIGVFVFSTYQAISTWAVSTIQPCAAST